MINCGTRLTELDLSDNAFGPIGAESIETFLESPAAYSLQVLKLNNNGLGAGGKVSFKKNFFFLIFVTDAVSCELRHYQHFHCWLNVVKVVFFFRL